MGNALVDTVNELLTLSTMVLPILKSLRRLVLLSTVSSPLLAVPERSHRTVVAKSTLHHRYYS